MTETFDSPKAWAISKGYPVKPGKGRMPKAISDEWNGLLRAGKVALTQKTTARPKPARVESPKTDKPKTVESSGVVETAPPRYGNDVRVYAFVDGKKVYGSMRAACFHSGLSLQWCPCPSHKAIVSNTSGYVPVRLEFPHE